MNALTREGYVQAMAGYNAGMLTARSLVEAAARDVQAKGRLQPWSSKDKAGSTPPVVPGVAPALGEGQGRRITNSQMATQSKACNAVGGDGRLYRWPTLHLK